MTEAAPRPDYIDEGALIAADKLIRRGLLDPKAAGAVLWFKPAPGDDPFPRLPSPEGLSVEAWSVAYRAWLVAFGRWQRRQWDRQAVDNRAHVFRQADLMPLAVCMGRAVARGTLSQSRAEAILRSKHPECPVGLAVSAVARMISTARQHAADRDAAETRVRRAVWPLIEDRRPPGEVRAAALAVAAPLRRWEVVAICRAIVIRTQRRGRRRG